MDDTGKIVREVKVASEPEALLVVLKNPACHFKRIGLEAGPLSQWLFSALAEAELPVICVETRHMQAALKAQINKTDRNDARGIAQMMRGGFIVQCMSRRSVVSNGRMLLTHRKLLQSKAIAIENDLRGTLRNFGLKVGNHREGEVRGPHQRAGKISRPGCAGRTTACRPAGTTRTDRHPASPFAGHRAG